MTDPDATGSNDQSQYVAESLSEIYDLLGYMMLEAPRMGPEDDFLGRNINTVFYALTEGFERTRKQLGDERHAAAVDLAARAKALFADDPDDSNGKTDEGIKLLYEIEAIVQSARKRRYKAGFREEDDEATPPPTGA